MKYYLNIAMRIIYHLFRALSILFFFSLLAFLEYAFKSLKVGLLVKWLCFEGYFSHALFCFKQKRDG